MRRLINSFRFAIKGLRWYLNSGGNVTIHIVAGILAVISGCWLGLSSTQWCILVLVMAGVHVAEAFNTAIEHIVNFISPQHHHLAEKIKDISAAAVLISAVAALITGAFLFIPLLTEKFH